MTAEGALERTYTLDEARAHIERQRCSAQGHCPDAFQVLVGRSDSRARATYPCRCGQFEWLARPVEVIT